MTQLAQLTREREKRVLKIGGFFPIFSGLSMKSYSWRPQGIFLDSGRSALSLIVQQERPKRVFVPHYVCDSVVSTLVRNNVQVKRYEIDSKLSPRQKPFPNEDELFLVVNYFGVKEAETQALSRELGSRLIIDNTHNLFASPTAGTWNFRNIRKSVGLPDGAILNSPVPIDVSHLPASRSVVGPMFLRRIRWDSLAWSRFKAADNRFDVGPSKGSTFSEFFSRAIDSDRIVEARIKNFEYLDSHLGGLNLLHLSRGEGVPFSYPLLLESPVSRAYLASLGLYVPELWPEVSLDTQAPKWERMLASNILPLPIDHRYTRVHMDQIIRVLERSV